MKISKPEYGWVTISFYNVKSFNIATHSFTSHCSYLTDVMYDLIEGMINYYNTITPTMIRFDEEGSNWTLILTFDKVFIISERNTTEIYETNDTIESVTKEIIENCNKYSDDWVNWNLNLNETEKKYSKKYYIKRIKFLEELKNDYERRNNNDK